MTDFLFEDHGTLYLIHPVTPEGDIWVHETAPEDAFWFGGALVVEHHYVGDVLLAIMGSGHGWTGQHRKVSPSPFGREPGTRGQNHGKRA